MVALGFLEKRMSQKRRLMAVYHGKRVLVGSAHPLLLLIQQPVIINQAGRRSEPMLPAAGHFTTAAADTPAHVHQHSGVEGPGPFLRWQSRQPVGPAVRDR